MIVSEVAPLHLGYLLTIETYMIALALLGEDRLPILTKDYG
jgi:hypothetical protein